VYGICSPDGVCNNSSIMTQRPTLPTERLVLRPFELTDAPAVQRLAGDREIALNTATIPHPYPDGMAEKWIATHQEDFDAKKNLTLAIDAGELVGAVGLIFTLDEDRAEIGYWVGVPHWGKGYASEAAAGMLRYGFEDLGHNRIHAGFYTRNPASGRVMEKIGMKYEGTLRQHHKKWGEFVDVAVYGILREEWVAR